MNETSSIQPFSNRFGRALVAAAILTFLMVMAGYLVRFDGAQGACSDWPTCYGNWGIPADLAAQMEISHRILAALSGLAVLSVTVWSYRIRTQGIAIRLFLTFAVIGIVLGSLVGRELIFTLPKVWASSVHLGLALLVMAFVTAAAVLGNVRLPEAKKVPAGSNFSSLAMLALLAVFLLMVSGAWLTQSETGRACSGWPLCSGQFPDNPAAWLAFSHRLLTLVSGILTAAIFFQAWKKAYHQPLILVGATGTGLLFLGQIMIGALKVSQGYRLDLMALHAASTAALWSALVLTTAAALVLPPQSPDTASPRLTGLPRVKAFLMLNKPVIVLLLLVTTYAGMVVGGKELPSFWLAFWTMMGGALAAGGASALNQVIDREIDGRMQRTAKRPLPSGSLTPAEGLAYGLGACLAAFFILAGFVNLLAAVLSLAGMVYYVLLYSLWLKHATVQNIVIGGGAGAIPPLVGWAAATGSINIPSLFLFAIVFMWTPPHFWALAIVRKNDYARAGVPMLPVIKGERNTRVKIFIYTLELVGLTLLMPLFNLAGSLFLVSAVVLGMWLISAAWKVLKEPGNKVAWRMYRYSSMYLAFIFLALVLDVLI